jgi:hypothetical protein
MRGVDARDGKREFHLVQIPLQALAVFVDADQQERDIGVGVVLRERRFQVR